MSDAEKKQVPEEIKNSDFGCLNCLWSNAECTEGSLYNPIYNKSICPEIPFVLRCGAYSYYD
jgi:hypothetical protein